MANPLADRGKRFFAALADGSLIMVAGLIAAIFIPILAKGSGADTDPTMKILLFGVIGIYVLAIAGVQIMMLHKSGQTIGKKLLGIKIVMFEDGSNGGLMPNFVLRALVPGLIGAVPLLGAIFSIVNICFIFRDDRRCLHDLIAKTHVVMA